MPLDLSLRPEQRFHCPLCGKGLDVRQTKKNKPYVICDPCGVELFVRGKVGMHVFERLVSDAGDARASFHK
jgi:predicted nucleic acid-binding Zn ribbon protein